MLQKEPANLKNQLELFNKATENNQEQLVEILANAFQNDPVITYVSTSDHYPKFLFKMFVPFYLKHGEALINQDQTSALLYQIETASFKPSVSQVCKFIYSFGLKSFFKLLYVGHVFSKHTPKEPIIYLFSIGTSHDSQGLGLGRLGMEALIKKADGESKSIYLENSNPDANRRFYESFGFETTGSINLNGTQIDLMTYRQ